VRSTSFAGADLDTALIPREQKVLFQQEPVGCDFAVAATVAHALLAEQLLAQADPFSRRDGWRAFGTAMRVFGFEFQDQSVEARLRYLHDGALHLQVGGTEGVLSFAQTDAGIDVRYAGQRHRVHVYAQGEHVHVFARHGATRLRAIDLLDHAGDSHGEGGRLTAPMPGKVLSFAVKAGDKVRKGQALAVMEAMKMEHTIAAPADGTVAELLYAPGDQVTEGSELLKMAS
jgi:3-methylcrotonyl-CoA carboxylase alpha subunit